MGSLVVAMQTLVLKFVFNWRILALQCCVGFCHEISWIRPKYASIPSFLNLPLTPTQTHPSGSSQSAWLTASCYRAASHWLSINLHTVMHMFQCCSLNSSRDLLPWPEVEPGACALGAQGLSHWSIRKVTGLLFVTANQRLSPDLVVQGRITLSPLPKGGMWTKAEILPEELLLWVRTSHQPSACVQISTEAHSQWCFLEELVGGGGALSRISELPGANQLPPLSPHIHIQVLFMIFTWYIQSHNRKAPARVSG